MVKKYSFTILMALTLTQMIQIQEALAGPKGFSVFDIRKNLPLNDDEPVYRDHYINMGTENGARPGAFVAVHRRLPVIDIYRSKAQEDLMIPIAHMKIIHVQKGMSVARVVSKVNPEQIPVVQFEQVMLGDRVELVEGIPSPQPAEAKTDNPKNAEQNTTEKAPQELNAEAKEVRKKVSKEVKAAPNAAPKVEAKPVAQGPLDVTTTRN